MATVWTLIATACPAIQVPTSFLTPGAEASIRAEQMVSGTVNNVASKFGINASHLDNVGMAGGVWAHAIVYGFDITDGGGLVANVSAGGAGVGAAPTVAGAQTPALTDNSDNYLWVLQDGTLSIVLGTTAAPADAAAYLGMVTTLSGAITVIDYSGRVENRGGTLYRRTADAGAPADTPPAGLAILTQTAGGEYLWDGAAYRNLTPTLSSLGGGPLVVNTTPISNTLTGEDTLQTYTVPAATLAANGDRLEIVAFGEFAANVNVKQVKLYFGATILYATGAVAANAGAWLIKATVIRTGAALQIAIAEAESGNALVVAGASYTAPAETLSGTVIVKATGEATLTGDVTQRGMIVTRVPGV